MAAVNYTPDAIQTYYYDAKHRPASQPVQDGYYREVLGKTADGRALVQHFYQNSGKPATLCPAPYPVMADGVSLEFDDVVQHAAVFFDDAPGCRVVRTARQ